MNIYKIVKKLIGKIEPVGAEHIDKDRFENLERTIDLIEKLLDDIESIAEEKNGAENSIRKAGERAYDFRDKLTGW